MVEDKEILVEQVVLDHCLVAVEAQALVVLVLEMVDKAEMAVLEEAHLHQVVLVAVEAVAVQKFLIFLNKQVVMEELVVQV
jgi:hypothetical protein